MNKLVESQLRAKNLRKSIRKIKKFFVFIGKSKYTGYDVSDSGISFSFDSHDYVTLLKHQKTNINIYFVNESKQTLHYGATIKIVNLRQLSDHEMLYGCQVINVDTPELHKLLLTTNPENYPSPESTPSTSTKPTHLSSANSQNSKVHIPSLFPNKKQIRNEILIENAKLIQLLRRESVNECISCEEFRELALQITNKIVENDWFKKIENF